MTDPAETQGTETAAEPTAAAVRTATLADLGYNLPLGIPTGAVLAKAFAFRPYTMAQDKAIARDFEANADSTEAAKVTSTLKHLLVTLGDMDLSEAKPEEVEAHVKGMFFGDVMFAYVMARVASLGKGLSFPYRCPFCGTPFVFEGDLTTIRVRAFDTPESLEQFVTLPVPWKLRDKAVTRLLLRPSPWGMIEGKMHTPVHYQAAIMQGAILGADDKEDGPLDGERLRLTPFEVDSMPKRIINFLNDEVARTNGGPELSVRTTCPSPGCKRELDQPLDWSYESFFG